MKHFLPLFLLPFLMLGWAGIAQAQKDKEHKITILHKGKNVIEVSIAALDAHLAHGDEVICPEGKAFDLTARICTTVVVDPCAGNAPANIYVFNPPDYWIIYVPEEPNDLEDFHLGLDQLQLSVQDEGGNFVAPVVQLVPELQPYLNLTYGDVFGNSYNVGAFQGFGAVNFVLEYYQEGATGGPVPFKQAVIGIYIGVSYTDDCGQITFKHLYYRRFVAWEDQGGHL